MPVAVGTLSTIVKYGIAVFSKAGWRWVVLPEKVVNTERIFYETELSGGWSCVPLVVRAPGATYN